MSNAAKFSQMPYTTTNQQIYDFNLELRLVLHGNAPPGFQKPNEIPDTHMFPIYFPCPSCIPALRSPRQLARFLCGINSPAATGARLGRHGHFAHLTHLPFQDVLALTESMIL